MESKSRTAGQYSFANVPTPEIQRSSFQRNHGHKTTFNAGDLVPIFVDEALPGDTFTMKTHMFGRIATLIDPIMDNMHLDTFFFAVPYRLVWDNWVKFMGEQTNPGDSTDYLIPTLTSGAISGYAESTIFDYFGIPTQVPSLTHSVLPLRAYNLIWNEWFRDQNLQDSVDVFKDDGPDSNVYTLLKRGKRHDYFTSCLPWPQKGDAVSLPLTGDAPLVGFPAATPVGTSIPKFSGSGSSGPLQVQGSAPYLLEFGGTSAASDLTWASSELGVDLTQPGIYADLSAVTASTINELRQAFQIQRLLERDARGGTRYTEVVYAHFGVTSPDARLQRPEYLGGTQSALNVQPVAATTDTVSNPQATLSAYGTFAGSGGSWTHSFTEHCIVIGLACLRGDLNYQQGLERMWSRQTRYDFYWPALAHLGEQAVLNKEIYAQGTSVDEEVFGYQERFAEYRYKPSRISGEFRSNAATPLDSWHLSQDFASLPTLSAAFIEEDPPVSRVIAIPTEPHILFDSYFEYQCARPMPTYSIPGLIDHF